MRPFWPRLLPLFLPAILLLAPVGASARQLDSATAPSEVRAILAGGGEARIVPDTTVPLVSLVIAARHPIADEGWAAYSRLLPGLVMRPLPDDPRYANRAALNLALGQLGISYKAGHLPGGVYFSIITQPRFLRPAAELLMAMLTDARHDSLSVRKATLALADAEQQSQSAADYFLRAEIANALYGEEGQGGFLPTPTFAPVRKAGSQQVAYAQRKLLRPDNLLMMIGGDVQPGPALALADSLFAAWPAATLAADSTLAPHHGSLLKDELLIVVNEKTTAPRLTVAWPLPGLATDSTLLLRANLLAGLLQQTDHPLRRLLQRRRLARTLVAEAELLPQQGWFRLTVIPTRDSLLACYKALRGIPALLSDPSFYDTAMVARVLARTEAELVFRKQENSAFCLWLTEGWVRGDHTPYDTLLAATQPQHVANWTGLLRGFAGEHLADRPAVYGALATSTQPGLEALETYVYRYNERPQPAQVQLTDAVLAEQRARMAAANTLNDSLERAAEALYRSPAADTLANTLVEQTDTLRSTQPAADSLATQPADQAPSTDDTPDEPESAPDSTVLKQPSFLPVTDTATVAITDSNAPLPVWYPVDTTGLRQLYAPDTALARFTLFFPLDEIALDSAGQTRLAQLAAILAEQPSRTLYINGHSDLSGNPDHNRALSSLRARYVRDQLVQQHSVSRKQLRFRARGESQPLFDEKPKPTRKRARALNRRVEFTWN